MAAQKPPPLPHDLIFSSPSSSSPAPVAGAGEYLLQLLRSRPAPLPSAAYGAPESAAAAAAPGPPAADEDDEPYAHLALHHDPAVAAMGPCHGQRHSLLHDLHQERAFFQHQQNQQHLQHLQHHPHQHHQYQHLHQHQQHQQEHKPHHHHHHQQQQQHHQGFPGMSSPQFREHYMDSFVDPFLGRPTPSVEQNQFFGSYPYRLVDHKPHVQMPPPGFGPSGLMNSNRTQELNPSLVPHLGSESLENISRNLPHPSFAQSGQHVVPGSSMGVENRRSYSQTSSLEQHDALVNKYMHAFMNVQDANPPAVPPERSLHQQEQQSRVAPPRQPDLHAYEISNVQNGATMPVTSHQNSSDILNSKEFLENGRKVHWKQKHIQVAQDSNAFNRNSVPDWIAVSQDKRHEDREGGTPRLLGMREEIPTKRNHDGEKQRGQTVERRSKYTHVLSLQSKEHNEHNSRSRIKSSIQDSRVGLPSGTGRGIGIDSITDFATDTLKKALRNSLPAGDEGMADEENADKTILGCIKFLDLNDDNAADKHIQHLPISKVMRPTGRVMMLQKFNQRELPTRFDSEKCTKQFISIIETLIPPIDEEIRRKKLLAKLKEIVSGIWPDAQLYLFGSCANAFAVCNSDIDICLSVETEDSNKAKVVRKLAEVLEENEMQNVQALTHARVPIVKYSDPETGMSCDVCVNNMLAVENTKLLHDYAQIDVRLRQLAFLVKHWAKCRQVNETYRGTLSSYAYVLMCIHFLQQRKPPVLPCLQGMEPTFQKTVGDIECAYFDRVENLKGFGNKNKESLADLVASFFEYWAFGHDYRRSVISIRTGRFLSKMEKDWTRRIGNERHLICIEDPFEISHDLGRVVDKYSIHSLKEEFLRAARIMQNDEDPWVTLFKRQEVEEDIQ